MNQLATIIIDTGGLIGLLIAVAIVGVICWAISLLPMPQPFKIVIWVIAVLILVVMICRAFGIFIS